MIYEFIFPFYKRTKKTFLRWITNFLFIIFDIEIIFLYPWAVVFKDFLSFGSFIFFEMVIFLAILVFGYVYVWRNGALDWE